MLEDGDLIFCNEEEVLLIFEEGTLSGDRAIQLEKVKSLEKLAYCKTVQEYEECLIVDLNFDRRSILYQDYLIELMKNDLRFTFLLNEIKCKTCKIAFKISRESAGITILAQDNILKRELDLPRRLFDLFAASDWAYHFEEALMTWIELQALDLESIHSPNTSSIDLVEALLQDVSSSDVVLKQCIESIDREITDGITLDINHENQVIIRQNLEIRVIQLPQCLECFELGSKAFQSLQTIINYLIKDMAILKE